MEIKKKIKEICNKPVKDREDWEHHFLIKMKYGGKVRDYFLSMGEFKEEDELTELMKEKLRKIENDEKKIRKR